MLTTCLREWGSGGGTRRDFMVGCPLAAAAVLSYAVQPDRWIAPHLAVAVGLVVSLSRSGSLFFGLLPGCLLLIRVGVPSRLRFGGFGRCMMIGHSLCLSRMLSF